MGHAVWKYKWKGLLYSNYLSDKVQFSQLSYLFSTISSVRCNSSLLLFSLLLIISKMVTARLKSRRSFSIFSYEASSFFRFWKQQWWFSVRNLNSNILLVNTVSIQKRSCNRQKVINHNVTAIVSKSHKLKKYFLNSKIMSYCELNIVIISFREVSGGCHLKLVSILTENL